MLQILPLYRNLVPRFWAGFLGTVERAGGMGWSEKGKEAGLGWGEEGRRERFGPPGWVWAFYFLSSFLFQTKLKLFEFKLEFEFNPSTQTNKTMHQHECTHVDLRKNLIICGTKIRLNDFL